jgi:hypothetical protein
LPLSVKCNWRSVMSLPKHLQPAICLMSLPASWNTGPLIEQVFQHHSHTLFSKFKSLNCSDSFPFSNFCICFGHILIVELYILQQFLS